MIINYHGMKLVRLPINGGPMPGVFIGETRIENDDLFSMIGSSHRSPISLDQIHLTIGFRVVLGTFSPVK
jgi:hypothetical protein